jgi:hypothetical protein
MRILRTFALGLAEMKNKEGNPQHKFHLKRISRKEISPLKKKKYLCGGRIKKMIYLSLDKFLIYIFNIPI